MQRGFVYLVGLSLFATGAVLVLAYEILKHL